MAHLFDIPYILGTYGYAGILIIVFLESGIFFLLPGDSLLFTAGLLATVLHFNIILLVFAIFLAAFLGGVAGYYIGTKLEYFERLNFSRKFFQKIIKKEHIESTHAFLDKHGLSAILLSRFIPVVRTFLPIVAGMVRMKYSDFIRYSLLGSLLWSAVFTFGGYFLGKSFPHLQDYLLLVILSIVFVSLLPGVYHYFKNKKA